MYSLTIERLTIQIQIYRGGGYCITGGEGFVDLGVIIQKKIFFDENIYILRKKKKG
jgi:hypothetical protein